MLPILSGNSNNKPDGGLGYTQVGYSIFDIFPEYNEKYIPMTSFLEVEPVVSLEAKPPKIINGQICLF